jgi:dihydrofolate reductase
VIGGAELFAAALPAASTIELTRVHGQVPADTFLPDIDPALWRETYRERHPADAAHAWPFSFVTLVRVADAVAPERATPARDRSPR